MQLEKLDAALEGWRISQQGTKKTTTAKKETGKHYCQLEGREKKQENEYSWNTFDAI